MTTTIEVLSKDWPDWMRQARQGIDWGIVLIFAFSLTIAMPFLARNYLSHTNASENYVYRSADYAAALQEGRLYPRWSANAFGGYGAPIPHYLPPGAGYAAAVIQVLFEYEDAGAFEARAGGQKLCQHILAAAAVFEHIAQATHLPFDAREPVE